MLERGVKVKESEIKKMDLKKFKWKIRETTITRANN
jgi:hypothetical protein